MGRLPVHTVIFRLLLVPRNSWWTYFSEGGLWFLLINICFFGSQSHFRLVLQIVMFWSPNVTDLCKINSERWESPIPGRGDIVCKTGYNSQPTYDCWGWVAAGLVAAFIAPSFLQLTEFCGIKIVEIEIIYCYWDITLQMPTVTTGNKWQFQLPLEIGLIFSVTVQ